MLIGGAWTSSLREVEFAVEKWNEVLNTRYFHIVLYVVLFKLVLTFKSASVLQFK